jgi:S-adenosylmethionine:tRNA ribosyltransferase-isomerase
MAKLTLKDFHYELGDDLIAQVPLPKRDQARLLAWKGRQISHHTIANLPELLPTGTLLVMNDTRVIPSRLFGRLSTGGQVEIFLLEPNGDGSTWEAMGRPFKKLREDTVIEFDGGLKGTIVNRLRIDSPQPSLTIRFSIDETSFLSWLHEHGRLPLPPYIKREVLLSDEKKSLDKERYQTVYADQHGSVAAPTAGLHFTPEVLEALAQRGVQTSSVTLHVGAGTFLPVKTDDIDQHEMHSERYLVPSTTLELILKTKAEDKPVIAVGTTSLRTLEGFFHSYESIDEMKKNCDRWQRTNIFIRPNNTEDKHKPWCFDAIMTNFHQPESTLLMLVSALIGYPVMRNIYEEAIKEKYRFFSYGDSSLLWF